jgi:hypothetical protein
MQHSHNIVMSAAVGARGSGRLLLAPSLTTLAQEGAVLEMVELVGWLALGMLDVPALDPSGGGGGEVVEGCACYPPVGLV